MDEQLSRKDTYQFLKVVPTSDVNQYSSLRSHNKTFIYRRLGIDGKVVCCHGAIVKPNRGQDLIHSL